MPMVTKNTQRVKIPPLSPLSRAITRAVSLYTRTAECTFCTSLSYLQLLILIIVEQQVYIITSITLPERHAATSTVVVVAW